MVAAGDRAIVLESTSHGLAQDRVAEVAYDVALITNLTHEHLEFHRTHEAYRAAKRRLFAALAVSDANPEKGRGKTGIVNVDDAWAGEFVDATRDSGARLVTYAGAALPAGDAADIRLAGLEERPGGFVLDVETPRWRGPVGLRLAGRFNAANALAAVAVGEALGLDPAAIRAGIESIDRVPGRMERVDSDAPFTVMVDFAHTPHSLELVLEELAPLARSGGGGLIAVFGSAGERDTVKRPVMGRVAAERCRLTVVTDEDPRGEDHVAICEEVAAGAEAAGARRGESLLVIPDRAEAIAAAFDCARPGDVVVLAGKGHERTIEMAGGDLPWNERAVAETVLRARGWQTR
jgi:UDP-N-acetylmuramoyl-L-alanyl-D-glutamate--2,6-diaminopimelate ligase